MPTPSEPFPLYDYESDKPNYVIEAHQTLDGLHLIGVPHLIGVSYDPIKNPTITDKDKRHLYLYNDGMIGVMTMNDRREYQLTTINRKELELNDPRRRVGGQIAWEMLQEVRKIALHFRVIVPRAHIVIPKERRPQLTWISLDQKAAEFEAAQHAFKLSNGKNAGPGTMLQKGIELNIPGKQSGVKLSYRYLIDAKGVVYAVTATPFASGTYSQVYYAETSEGERWVIKKIDNKKTGAIHEDGTTEEEKIIEELHLTNNGSYTDDSNRVIICKYLGVSLEDFLKENREDLTTCDLLNIIVQMCKQVMDFHALGYVHLDIKLSNFSIDDDRKIRLIDFGFSRKRTTSSRVTFGTPNYVTPRIVDNLQPPSIEFDIFALARSICFPESYNYVDPHLRTRTRKKPPGMISVLENDCIDERGKFFMQRLTSMINLVDDRREPRCSDPYPTTIDLCRAALLALDYPKCVPNALLEEKVQQLIPHILQKNPEEAIKLSIADFRKSVLTSGPLTNKTLSLLEDFLTKPTQTDIPFFIDNLVRLRYDHINSRDVIFTIQCHYNALCLARSKARSALEPAVASKVSEPMRLHTGASAAPGVAFFPQAEVVARTTSLLREAFIPIHRGNCI